MMADLNNKFAKLAWKDRLWDSSLALTTKDGAAITILERGEQDDKSDDFAEVKLIVGGVVQKGKVTFRDRGVLCDNDTILQVLVAPGERLCKTDGELIPQTTLPVDKSLTDFYKTLLSNSGDRSCGKFIASLDGIQLNRTITRLLLERLEEKYADTMTIYHDGGDNWNHAVYVLLFAAMGLSVNKVPFTRLAYKVPHDVVSKESGDPSQVEALLLGAAGILQIRDPHDTYIRKAMADFEHLQSKYGIKPLEIGEWTLKKTYPNGFAGLRISQLAGFLCTSEFIFNNLIACRTAKDVQKLFSASASQYWSDDVSRNQSSSDLKRIGEDRKDVIGINMVVQIMFAYGKSVDEEELAQHALGLLEDIPAENNAIIKSWNSGGVRCKNAFDSQGMLQLSKKYCRQERCCECPFGKAQINNKFNENSK